MAISIGHLACLFFLEKALTAYQKQTTPLIRSVDKTKLNNYWIDYEGHRVTLDNMIRGYINHLNLHLHQIHELIETKSRPETSNGQFT